MNHETLILASASPRRHRLLAEMGVAFEVVVPQVDEVHYLDDLHGSVRADPWGRLQQCACRPGKSAHGELAAAKGR